MKKAVILKKTHYYRSYSHEYTPIIGKTIAIHLDFIRQNDTLFCHLDSLSLPSPVASIDAQHVCTMYCIYIVGIYVHA